MGVSRADMQGRAGKTLQHPAQGRARKTLQHPAQIQALRQTSLGANSVTNFTSLSLCLRLCKMGTITVAALWDCCGTLSPVSSSQ